MAKIIDGKKLADTILNNIAKEVAGLGGGRPGLAIILVGQNPDSELYVSKKEKTAKTVGIDTHCYRCEADVGQEKILEMIDFFNKDEAIDAIMVQLPLPKDKGYDTDEIIKSIRPEKDVDRFHPKNIEPIKKTCNPEFILPPVFGVILEMLKSINCGLENKSVVIISKSEIFGGSLAKALFCKGARAEVCRPDNKNLISKTSQADILIPVVGRPKFIKKGMIKKDAIIIDVGITREMGSVYGDVDFEDVKDRAGYISPVPGGVGPMTVAMTLKNTLELHKRRKR